MTARIDKWTAFVCSLLLPGAGQFLAGSLWCVVWFAAVLAVGRLNGFLPAADPDFALIPVLSLIVISVLSAEHAKRLVEPRRSTNASTARSRVIAERTRGRRVNIRLELDIPLAAETVWHRIADLPRFLAIDPFHDQVILTRSFPAAGVDLILHHNVFGIRFPRFGRILRWREGHDYAFSDLSARGTRRGFPHVFFVRVQSRGAGKSCLCIRVRGKWTAWGMPRPLRNLWLSYVFHEHARLLRKAL